MSLPFLNDHRVLAISSISKELYHQVLSVSIFLFAQSQRIKAKLFKIDQGEVKEVIVSICSSFISQHRMVNVFHESQSFLVSVDQRQRVFLRMDG